MLVDKSRVTSESESCMTLVLLEEGADANVKDEDGLTPLLKLTRGGRYQRQLEHTLCHFLIGYGADVNAIDKLSRSPLSYVAQSGDAILAAALSFRGLRVTALILLAKHPSTMPVIMAIKK